MQSGLEKFVPNSAKVYANKAEKIYDQFEVKEETDKRE